MSSSELSLIATILVVAIEGCGGSGPPLKDSVCTTWIRAVGSSEVTSEDIAGELRRLPPALRSRFNTEDGRRELSQSILDRRLMLREALKRKLDADAQFQAEVAEVEEKLLLKLLLDAEEKAAGAPSDEKLRAWYADHQADFRDPERVRLLRILVTTSTSDPGRATARRRAEALLKRLRAGEKFEHVAASGDGPERTQGGAFGVFSSSELHDSTLSRAAFELREAHQQSGLIETQGGLVILQLEERLAARTRTFEEARSEVLNAVLPSHKRQVFDSLLLRLRKSASASTTIAAAN